MHNISSFDQYQEIYKRSIEDPESFWAEVAEDFQWRKKWDQVLEWDFSKPEVKWFQGGKLNITENCIDRHLEKRGDKTAIIWEPNDPDEEAKHITYRELHSEVCKTANMLKSIGVKKGDRICIYMPMVPELAYAVLACARIGAVHSVVFAGFSSNSLTDRINDASCRFVLTADGGFRGSKSIDLKKVVDDALEKCHTIEKVVVLKRTNTEVTMTDGRDIWWHDAISSSTDSCPVEEMDAEDLLFILYTSGSTGKPKGMVHTCGGYMVFTSYTFKTAFQYQEEDIYWCTADIGWITGHSYIIYGPLAAGATTVMFEGVPTYPDMGRFWDVVERHKVNIFYTAPTAIRALMKGDLELVEKHDLSSLRVIGTVGEPINEEAWHWYDDHIGKNNCPVIDTWWQTETGGFMISPIADVTPLKPTFASYPMPGIQPALMDESGKEINKTKAEGRLTIKFPWPSIARTIYGDHERFKKTYFSAFDGYYFSGDGARRDEEGLYRITGRVDDIIIVSGHNLGTAEIESAIDEHQNVVESAVVDYPHDVKGRALYAFVIANHDPEDEESQRQEVRQLVSDLVGPVAKPDKIQFVNDLPKTRSGKIMRRILRKIASDEFDSMDDVSTLLNPDIVEEIKNGKL